MAVPVFERHVEKLGKSLVLVLLTLTVSCSVLAFDPRLAYESDDSSYLIAAKAFNNGHGLVYDNYPDAPPATERAIGFPFALALVFGMIGGPQILVAKLLVLMVYLILTTGVFLSLAQSKFITPLFAFATTAAFALNPYVIESSHSVMAEMPYALLSLISLVLAHRLVVDKTRQLNLATMLILLCSAGTALAAVYMRSIGIILLLIIPVSLVISRKIKYLTIWLGALSVLIAIVVVSAGKVMGSPLSGYSDGAGILSRIGTAVTNAMTYGRQLGRVVFPFLYDALPHVPSGGLVGPLVLGLCSILILALVLFGYLRLWSISTTLSLYLPLYVGVLCLWPYVDAPRFLLPVLPLLIFCFALGFNTFTRLGLRLLTFRRSRRDKPLPAEVAPDRGNLGANGPLTLSYGTLILIAIMVSHLFLIGWRVVVKKNNVLSFARLAYRPEGYAEGKAEYFQAALWAKANLPASTVAAVSRPFDFFLWSGLKTWGFAWPPWGHSAEDVPRLIENSDILVEDNYWPSHQITQMVGSDAGHYRLLYDTGGAKPTRVYQVLKGSGSNLVK